MATDRTNARVKNAPRILVSEPRYSSFSRAAAHTAHTAGASIRARGNHPWRSSAAESSRYTVASPYDDSVGVRASPGFSVDDDELALDEELKIEFERSALTSHRRPQRVKYVKFRTRIHPEVLVPYLYRGDRSSRINAIIERTGCTIDYCPQSPDDEGLDAPPGIGSPDRYLISFLVGAETSAQLETACRLLRVLVDRVQEYVESRRTQQRVERPQATEDSPGAASASLHTEPESDLHSPDDLKPEPRGSMRSKFSIMNQGSGSSRSAISSMRPRLVADAWMEEPSDAAMEAHHVNTQRHGHTGSFSGRYRRPVYRRILVDEDGYEVYPSHVYEGRRVEYRGAAVMASPPRGRRRHSDDMQPYHEVDEGQVHFRAHVPATLSCPRKYSDDQHIHADSEVLEGDHHLRRGMKRRLDDQSAAHIQRHHPYVRRGPRPYHFLASEDEQDSYFSGDGGYEEFDFASDDSMFAQRPRHEHVQREVHTRTESLHRETDDSHHPYAQDPVTSPATAVGPDNPSSPGAAEVVCSQESAMSHPDDDHKLSATSDAVDTNVSIAFGDRDDFSMAEAPSDAESEGVEVRTAVIPHDVIALAAAKDVEVADVETSKDQEPSSPGEEVTPDRTENVEGVPDSEITGPVEEVSHVAIESLVPVAHDSQKTRREMLNSTMIGCLDADSKDFATATKIRHDFIAARTRLAELETEAQDYECLRKLADAVRSFESCVWRQGRLGCNSKEEALAVLDAAIEEAKDHGKPVDLRVLALRDAVLKVMPSAALPSVDIPAQSAVLKPESPTAVGIASEVEFGEPGDSEVMMLEASDELFAPADPQSTSDFPKPALITPMSIPNEAPQFVANLVKNLEQSSGFSSAMASAQRRLLQEIGKSDPYYYLNVTQVSTTTVRKGNKPNSCPFGCVGASSHKWEHKLVSQISSRMKWFDSVAYSLAKMSGGKQPLSRKKMNSTIRKLHLVAVQVHCLIVHLYCVRKRVLCREIDSLPTALNNSYHEKRMNGYKSRIRLSVHQPPASMAAASNSPLPPDDLLRDTFEFFPELLLCIDMWGYDYRSARPIAGVPPVPTEFLQKKAKQAFDFEADSNGLLQGVCEELLDILCVWNDFKWGESLETLTLDQIVSFEAEVKGSIRKVLETHASHLLAQWALRLINRPVVLNSFRLTQTNVYYAEQVSSAISDNATWVMSDQPSTTFPSRGADDTPSFEHEHEPVGDDAWRTEFDSTESLCSSEERENEPKKNTDDDTFNLAPLRPDQVLSTVRNGTEATKNKSSAWGDVFGMRQTCLNLSEATGDLLKADAVTDSIDASVESLLTQLHETRSLMRDAVLISEKLTLHSASLQASDDSDDEDARSSNQDRDAMDAMGDSKTNNNEEEEEETKNQPTHHEPEAQAEKTASLEGPELKDLIEIVTSTNQEVAEICTQRARSARVRNKLQAQSLELARQSVQLFQTILHANR